MPRSHVDVPTLYAALDGARRERGLSWRQLATEVGCSPSTMTRMANGHRPDVDAFVALTAWLRMPAETFSVDDGDHQDDLEEEQPPLLAEVGVLLRARKDLGNEERNHLQQVIEAAMRLNSAQRADRNR